MVRYFNFKNLYGIETVDEINYEDFKTYKKYIAELRRLKQEYRLCGMNVYVSQRATKNWRESK